VVDLLVEALSEATAHDWLDLLVSHQLLNRAPIGDGLDGLALNRQHPVVARRAGHLV
jgi:hypothetical protein